MIILDHVNLKQNYISLTLDEWLKTLRDYSLKWLIDETVHLKIHFSFHFNIAMWGIKECITLQRISWDYSTWIKVSWHNLYVAIRLIRNSALLYLVQYRNLYTHHLHGSISLGRNLDAQCFSLHVLSVTRNGQMVRWVMQYVCLPLLLEANSHHALKVKADKW